MESVSNFLKRKAQGETQREDSVLDFLRKKAGAEDAGAYTPGVGKSGRPGVVLTPQPSTERSTPAQTGRLRPGWDVSDAATAYQQAIRDTDSSLQAASGLSEIARTRQSPSAAAQTATDLESRMEQYSATMDNTQRNMGAMTPALQQARAGVDQRQREYDGYEQKLTMLQDTISNEKLDAKQRNEAIREYNALLPYARQAAARLDNEVNTYNSLAGQAQQMEARYNEALLNYQQALPEYDRISSRGNLDAKAFRSEGDKWSQRAKDLEAEANGTEALHPDFTRMTPEQVGEWQQNYFNLRTQAQEANAKASEYRRQEEAAQKRYQNYQYNQLLAGVEKYQTDPNWDKLAKADPEKMKPFGKDASTGIGLYRDSKYAIINGSEAALQDSISARADTWGAVSEVHLTKMNDREKAAYNYLYATKGKDAADAFLKELEPTLNARQRESDRVWWTNYAKEQPWGASAFSVLASPMKAISLFGQAADLIQTGNIDQNAAYNKFSYVPSDLRGAVSEQIEKKWGKAGSFAYQTGMSMADFLFQSAITGEFFGASAGATGLAKLTKPALLIMGSGAAADTVVELRDRGVDSTRAMALGTVAGLAEIVTENVSLENLLNPDKLADGVIRYVLKNMAAEGSEELGSDAINWAADALYDLVSGQDEAEWKYQIRQLQKEGMSAREATRTVLLDMVKQAGLDALGGALSGGIMAGGGAPIQLALNSNVGQAARAAAQATRQDLAERNAPAPIEAPAQIEGPAPVEAAAEAQPVSPLRAAVDKLAAGGQLTQNDGRRILRDETAMQTLRDAGVLTETVRDDAAGRQTVRQAAEQYAAQQAENRAQETQEEQQADITPAEEAPRTEGLRLPTAEETLTPAPERVNLLAQNRTEVNDNGTQTPAPAPAEQRTAPAPEAGAARNATAEQSFAERARAAAETERSRAILDRSERRTSLGRLLQNYRETRAQQRADQQFAAQKQRAAQLQHQADARDLAYTSAAELGVAGGTEKSTMQVIPQDMLDRNQLAAKQAAARDGVDLQFVLGQGEALDDNDVAYNFRGWISADGKRMIVQADHSKLTWQQILSHEELHRLIKSNPEYRRTVENALLSDKKLQPYLGGIVDRYVAAYHDMQVYDENEIIEEMLADYRAGFDMLDIYRGAAGNVAAKKAAAKDIRAAEKTLENRVDEQRPVSVADETKASREFNAKYMAAAMQFNEASKHVPESLMNDVAKVREVIKDKLDEIQDEARLPADVEGNTYFGNGSYNGSEENTTVCPRSLSVDALADAVGEALGRPLTVEESVYVAQQAFHFTDIPQCLYCYVAMDRMAKRQLLGEYINKRTQVLTDIQNGMSRDEAFAAFKKRETAGGKQWSKNKQARFDMWVRNFENGAPAVRMSNLASEDAVEKALRDPSLKAEMEDALQYAQNASWAKKRVGYTAYNGHILKWDQKRVDSLNAMFGLRLYSFSDYSPAYILENMQMVTDAAVRGLKMLAYTKELDFVKIFAGTGMNINISTFGMDSGDGSVHEDAMQGAAWKEAQELRKEFPNVGITFVATNDNQVNWALDQDWIDVVIPFHMVKTGATVAGILGYQNYTGESSDKKIQGVKARQKEIFPSQHQNDKQKYLDALQKAHLTPRFERWLDHPNYMKLVNETRRSAQDTPAVQPKFDQEAVNAALKSLDDMVKRGGYGVPIGGTLENLADIALEMADELKKGVVQDLKERNKGKASREIDDEAYMAAVESGDMDTAQRMVDEAARKAGYTVKAWHGTRAFGFTKFDPGKSDDGISLFATSNPLTAETYSGKTERRRVKDRSFANVYELHGKELISEAAKYNKRYQDYKLMSAKDKSKIREDERNAISWSIRRAQEFVGDHDGAFDKDKAYIMDRLISALYHLRDAETENDIEDAWSEWEDAVWDIKGIDDSIALEFLDDVDSRGLFMSKNRLSDMTYAGDMYVDDSYGSPDYIFDARLQLELDAELHKGIYELYGDPGKQLAIDTNGENWNSITPPKELRDYGLYGPQRTRDIASAAKALGYDSVLFKNLRDNGGETPYNGESDIYIFFNPKALKSADPVTYDDRGNVIHLSERFNTAETDIRYSREIDPEEAARAETRALQPVSPGPYTGGPRSRGRSTRGPKEKVSRVRTHAFELGGLYNEVEAQMAETQPEEFTYDPISEKRSMNEALGRLRKDFDGEAEKLASSDQWGGSDLDTAMGILYQYRQIGRETGDYSLFNEWSHVIQQKGTKGGQFVQAFAKYSRTATGVAQKAAENLRETAGKLNPKQQKLIEGHVSDILGAVDNGTEAAARDAVEKSKGKKGLRLPGGNDTQRARDAENIIKQIHKIFSQQTRRGHGLPVEEWTKATGDQLAGRIASRLKEPGTKTQTTMQTILGDLVTFAQEHALPTQEARQHRTALDRITDYLNNREAYAEAWGEAKQVLRDMYADDPEKLDALESFLNATITYNGDDFDRTMFRAILEASDLLGMDKQDILNLAAVGTTESVINRIADEFVRRVGVDDATLRDTVRRHIENIVRESNVDGRLERMESEASKELDIKIQDLLRESRRTKADAANRIAQYLINDLGISGTDAAIAANHIAGHYMDQLQQRADRVVERMFAEKKAITKKQRDKLLDLIHLGGLTNANVEDAVVDALGLNKVSREKQRQIMDAMAQFADTLDAIEDNDLEGLRSLIRQQAAIRNTELDRLAEKVLSGETDAEYLRSLAMAQLDLIAADYQARTRGEKISTIQVISHLLNARTAMRNLGSNQVFDLVDSLANNAGLLPDMIMSKITGQRSVGLNKSWASQQKRQGAIKGAGRNLLEIALDAAPNDRNQSKYGTGGRRTFSMANSGTVGKILSKLEQVLGYELNTTDEFHKGSVFGETIESLARWVDAGYMTMEEAEEFATEMMLYRSFQDSTIVGSILGGLKDVMNIVGTGKTNGKTIKGMPVHDWGLGDLVVKYTQVPGALVHRAIEYSPVGYLKAIYHMAQLANAKTKGEGTIKQQRKAALALGRATTGTGLITLFALMAKAGLLRRGDDEKDKNAAALKTSQGLSGTQLNLTAIERLFAGESTDPQKGDVLADIGFLEPLDSLMTIAALINNDPELKRHDLYEFFHDPKTASKTLEKSLEGIWLALENTSAMQTLSNIYSTVRYHDEENDLPLYLQIPLEIASSNISGFIPAPVRQIAQATDTTYRDQYRSHNFFSQTGAKVANAIPGLRQQLAPKITPLGEDKQYQAPVLNALNALLNPGNISVYQTTDVIDELDRVYAETGDAKIWPERNAPYKTTINKESYTLTPDERTQYQRTRGQLTGQMMDAVMGADWYGGMDGTQKADVLNWIGNYANYVAKVEFSEGRGMDYANDTYDKYYRAMLSGTPLEDVVAEAKGKIVEPARQTVAAEATIAAAKIPEASKQEAETMSAEAKRLYAGFLKGGVSDSTARDLATKLEGSTATGHEQWREVYDAAGKEGEKAVTSVMTDDMRRNWNLAKDAGVNMDDYIRVRENYQDLDGNGKQKQAEWNATLDSFTFDKDPAKDKQIKGTLWQILTGSSSTKNNPYDKAAGQAVIDAKEKGGSSGAGKTYARSGLRLPTPELREPISSGLKLQSTPKAKPSTGGLKLK